MFNKLLDDYETWLNKRAEKKKQWYENFYLPGYEHLAVFCLIGIPGAIYVGVMSRSFILFLITLGINAVLLIRKPNK